MPSAAETCAVVRNEQASAIALADAERLTIRLPTTPMIPEMVNFERIFVSMSWKPFVNDTMSGAFENRNRSGKYILVDQ